MKKPFNLLFEVKNALQIPLLNKVAVSEISKNGSVIFGFLIFVIPYFLVFLSTSSDPEMAYFYQEFGISADLGKSLLPILFSAAIAIFLTFNAWVLNLIAQKVLKGHGGFKEYLRPYLYSIWFGFLAFIPFSEQVDPYAQILLSLWGFVFSVFIIVTVYKFTVFKALVSMVLTYALSLSLIFGLFYALLTLIWI